MNVLKLIQPLMQSAGFENKNIRDFRVQLKSNSAKVLDTVKNHYLDKTAGLYDILRSKREKVLGELTFYQFTKYQAFHRYMDILTDKELDSVTTRKKTRRMIEDCKELRLRIENCNSLLDCTRDEIELREVA